MNADQLADVEEMIRQNADEGKGQFAIDEFLDNGGSTHN